MARELTRPAPKRQSDAPDYYYRRDLGPRELLPAVGAGVAAGLAVFYLVRTLLQRTPLDIDRDRR